MRYLAFFCFLLLGFFAWRLLTKPFLYRFTVAMVTPSELRITSLSADKNSAVVMTIPMDTVIDTTYGYGKYRLDSLLALDGIEKKHGQLFTTSIARSFGVPIDGYMMRNGQSNMPFFQRVRFTYGFWSLDQGNIDTIDLSDGKFSQSLLDGSSSNVLDSGKIDYLIGTSIIDAGLRNEHKSVAIYNTTQTPLIGTSTATMLKHIGISVLTVDNSDEELPQCVVSFGPSNKQSLTVQFLLQQFSCSTEIVEDQHYDIVLRLGVENARGY